MFTRGLALAQEVDPPFISVVEWAGDYRADFDAKAAADGVKRAIESCQDESLFVTALKGEELYFSVQPQSHAGSPEIVLWSLTDVDCQRLRRAVARRGCAEKD